MFIVLFMGLYLCVFMMRFKGFWFGLIVWVLFGVLFIGDGLRIDL